MQNFHYAGFSNNPKNTKLLEQLKMIDRQLQQDHKKLAERKKLQDEFYQDSNRMNLADEVMNQLLNKKPQPNQRNVYAPIKPQNNFEQMRVHSPPPNQVNFAQQKNNFNMVKQRQPTKQVQFVNKRELQKMKLQNQNAQQQFPFGGHSRQKQRRMKMESQNAPTRISPQRQYPVKNNYVVNDVERPRVEQQPSKVDNPFIKNDIMLRQKRQQQQKQYRRLLEEQMQEQKRRKEAQKQKYKQQLQQKFNNYTPTLNQNAEAKANQQTNFVVENNFKKKRDPNAQYTSLEKPPSQIRPSDLEFLKMQVETLKSKLKKGRINFQQYEQQIKKLQLHYKCKVQDIQDTPNQPMKKSDDGQRDYDNWNGQNVISNNSDQQKISQSRPLQQLQKRQNVSRNRNTVGGENVQFGNNYNNTSVPLQHMPMRPQPYPNYSSYHQSPVQAPNPQADYQMQMMFKILDEFKNMFKMQTQSYSTDKKVLQEALTKMIPVANPIMMTQQIPPNQLPPQKQFYTEAKKVERFDNFPRNNIQGIDYSTPHQSQSEISSSYIQKSMSGIVNKIPLTKKQKQEQKGDSGKDLEKFYSRKYKLKKFKGFEYKEVDNQSSLVIPSVSNFLQTKNSQNQLSQAFEKDLKNYKRLEKERQMVIMVEKIKKSKSGDLKSSPKKINQGSQATKNKQKLTQKIDSKYKMPVKEVQHQVNPFLKKHISNQSNYAQEAQQVGKPKQNVKNAQNFASPNPKNEILQQQQYETEPKKVESPRKQQKLKQKRNKQSTYQTVKSNQNKDNPSSKLMNIMKTNNQILAKYEMTPPHNPNHHIGSNSLSSIKEIIRADSSKELSSREYFSGHEISPVQRRQYESSLETVRSQEQSAKYERKNNVDLLVMGSAGQSSNFSHDYQSRNMMSPYPAHASPTIESIELQRRNQVSSNRYQHENVPNITGYSQTVQSISESSSRLPSFNRPPNNNNSKKSGRTVSRKKQSVVKLGQSGDSFQKSGLSGIPSQGSREKSSSLRDANYQDNNSNMQAPKFDSAVYQSAYEQSHEQPPTISISKEKQEKKQNEINPQNMIQFPKINKQILGNDSSFIKIKQSQIREQVIKQPTTSSVAPKSRSLDQARKLAREFKKRAGEEHNRSSVEEKLSELESILQTNKKDDSMLKNRRQQSSTPNRKRDIMKILDGLEEEEQEHYSPDFESYKQQSEK